MKKYCLAWLCILMICYLGGCNQDKTPLSASSDRNSNSSVTSEEPASTEKAASDDVIEITEKMYISYINDIYTNTSGYLGKTIQLEGMFMAEEYNGETHYFVYRVGPGCCGNDGSMCGFEFTFDGDIPQDNDWIEVIGELTSYEKEGNTYLSLKADTVTVKTERGQETVTQ